MAHFAKVQNGIVKRVIVAEQDFIDSYIDHEPGKWVQTSYNTRGGQHILGGTPLRKNFAGVGFTYDETKDAFIPPQPFLSWTLDDETCLWNPPVEYPSDDNKYKWNETDQQWDLIEE